MDLTEDICWGPSFTEALQRSARSGRPLFVVALGQGMGPAGDW